MNKINFVCSKSRGSISDDDMLLADALNEKGYEVKCVFWDDEDQVWNKSDIYINRCTWDYHLTPNKYLSWLYKMDDMEINLFNSPKTIIDNVNKEYLTTISNAVKTEIFNYPNFDGFDKFIEQNRDKEIIIKPRIGASGFLIYKVNSNDNNAIDKIIEKYVDEKKDILLQEYIKEVETHGEYSLIFFNNEFSHAKIAKPKKGDFRIQFKYGGISNIVEKPSKEMIKQAKEILQKNNSNSLYARVDGYYIENKFILSELELNEPYLSFGIEPKSIDNFINALIEKISR